MDFFKKYANQGYTQMTFTPVTGMEARAKANELRGYGHKVKVVRTSRKDGEEQYVVLAKEKGSNKKLK